jgi:hypothetical protein
MDAKKYLYASLGAPVVLGRKAQERLEAVRSRLTEESQVVGKDLQRQLDEWAAEGEKLVSRLGDTKVVDEWAAKVDFEQVQEQVTKLRDQLEDMLATWRANFRPEQRTEPAPRAESVPAGPAPATAAKPAAKKPAAKKPAAKKPAAKSAAATKKASSGSESQPDEAKAS